MKITHRILISLLALAGLVAGITSLRAADIVWTNTAGGNWSTAANWDPNQVPGSGDTAWIIPPEAQQ